MNNELQNYIDKLYSIQDWKNYGENKPYLLSIHFWLKLKEKINPSINDLIQINWLEAIKHFPINKKVLENILCVLPLHVSEEIICILLNRGANIDAINMNGETILFRQWNTKPRNIKILQLLLDNKADMRVLNSPLWNTKNLNEILLLLKHGADPNVQNNTGNTVLHKHIKKNNSDVVQLLLQYGANPNLGESCLKLALKNYFNQSGVFSNIVKLLLEHKVNIDDSVVTHDIEYINLLSTYRTMSF
jgi:ankyrin repeat protein